MEDGHERFESGLGRPNPDGELSAEEKANILQARQRANRIIAVTGLLPERWQDMKFAHEVVDGIDEGTALPPTPEQPS